MTALDISLSAFVSANKESQSARLAQLKEEIYRRSLARVGKRLDRLVDELNRQGHELCLQESDEDSEYGDRPYRDNRKPRFSISVSIVADTGFGDEAF